MMMLKPLFLPKDKCPECESKYSNKEQLLTMYLCRLHKFYCQDSHCTNYLPLKKCPLDHCVKEVLLSTLTACISSDDRFQVIALLDILNKLCPKCYGIYNERKLVVQHMKEVHSINHIKFKCEHCPKSNEEIIPGWSAKDSNLNTKCPICHKGFIYAYSLKFYMHSHKERHSKVPKVKQTNEIPQQINCELCGEEICSAKIRWHYKKYHPEKIDQSILLKCDHCDETFLDKMGLRKHMYNSHGDTKGSKVCQKCKLPYSNRHTCAAGKANRLQCHLCDRSFCDKKKLQAHIIGDHEKRKDYKCEYCTKAFACDFQRKNHIRQVHDNVNCELCKKTLSCEYELRRHMVFVHQETKGAFLCDICPKKVFFSNDKFKSHMNQVHPNLVLPN